MPTGESTPNSNASSSLRRGQCLLGLAPALVTLGIQLSGNFEDVFNFLESGMVIR